MAKLYFKIGEVCDITGLRPSVLRFWEKEFKQLRPTKSGGGQRFYTADDIELVKMLKRMLHDEKYTIEGVKRKLAEGVESVENEQKSRVDIKSELQDILDMLK